MARFEVSGIEAAQEAFLRRSERATKAVPKMLKAGGAVLVKAEQEEIRRTFTSNRVTGDLANSIKCTAVKKRGSGQCVEVYPAREKPPRGAERNRWFCPPIRANQHARAPVVHAFAPEGNAGSSSGYAAGMGGRTGMIDTVDCLLKSTLDSALPECGAPLLLREGWYIYHISACFFGRYGRRRRRNARHGIHIQG